MGIILPNSSFADCGSFIYPADANTSNPSSDPDPPVNLSTSLPDFVISKIWLENTGGTVKTEFTPGQTIEIKARVKNVGVDSPSSIEIRYYLSNGYKVDINKVRKETVTISASDMESGESVTKTEDLTAPTTLGTYNIIVCTDTQNVVAEEHESNNCSAESVFTVTTPNYTPVGSLEISTCEIAEGWASDPNTANPINVHVYAGDADGNNQVFQATVSANIYQANIGYRGFSWTVPETLKKGKFTLFFYAINVPAGTNSLIGQTQLSCLGAWFIPIMNYILE